MKRAFALAIPCLLASGTAFAASSQGNAALALAALIGARSPALSPADKTVLSRLLASDPVPHPGMRQIVVDAKQIRCRMGDVDITLHSCDVTFGTTTVTVAGHDGQMLLATMQENGVAADGAAGTIYYSVAPIRCTVDVPSVESHDGSGAACTYTNGP